MLDKNKASEVIIKKSKTGSTYKTWVFECSKCGGRISAQTTSLRTHSGMCRRCAQLGKPYAHILNELRTHKKYGIGVRLTYKQFISIIEDNDNCHYCGSDLIWHPHAKVWGVDKSRAHQLDRKDNNLNYTLENVVPCCWECNRLKSDRFTYEEFILLAPALKIIMLNRQNSDNLPIKIACGPGRCDLK